MGSFVFIFYFEELPKTVFFFLTWSLILVIIFFGLWKCYLNNNFDISFQKLKINLKKFHVFYLVEKLTCRKWKTTDRGADFLSFEDLHPLFHWQVSVGRCSAGNLEVSAYTGTATLRLVKTQGLPLGSNEEIWVYWFNSNTTEW